MHSGGERRREKEERENRRKENKRNITPVIWEVADLKTAKGASKEKRRTEELQGCVVCPARRDSSVGNAEGLSASQMPVKAKAKLENC